MKRKLICIFFMLAGLACLVGTILLSRGRSEFHNASPVYTLFFLSLITISVAAWYFSNELKSGSAFLWVFRVGIVLAMLAGFIFFIITLFPVRPFYSLLFFFAAISIAALMVASWNNEDEPERPEVSRCGMVFLWTFRVISILAILSSLAFIVIMWFLTGEYSDDAFQKVSLLMTLSVAGIAAASLSLKLRTPVSGRGKVGAARCIPIAAALAITFALGSVYLNYLPKYSIDDGLAIILSDKEFAQRDITGAYETVPSYHFEEALFAGNQYYIDLFGGNPYYTDLFGYQCDSFSYDADGLHIEKGFILFNPATGEYEFMRTKEQDKTYSSGDWPEFTANVLHDKDGQHNPVLNLYYRDLWYMGAWGYHPEGSEMNRAISVYSNEWDATLKDVMYPHSFPKDEAGVFLRSMGEEMLKTKLLEQIDLLGPIYRDKTIDLFFFGTEIGTYQDGEIVLKPLV